MSRGVRALVVMLGLACSVVAGCGDGAPPAEVPPAGRGADVRAPAAASPDASAPAAASRRIVFLGDSLTAGLGLAVEQSYPSLIETRLAGRGHGWSVTNAGVSGDTSAGALRRVDWALDGGAAIVLVALGGNDGLRGLSVADLERNLEAIVTKAKAAGATVVLAGMEAPPNNGPDYTRRFREVYPAVARRTEVTLLPFLLDGVAGDPALNQADGIHPNSEGARRIADAVWRVLEPLIAAREKAVSE